MFINVTMVPTLSNLIISHNLNWTYFNQSQQIYLILVCLSLNEMSEFCEQRWLSFVMKIAQKRKVIFDAVLDSM